MITGTLEHLRKPFEANVRPGQNVLIITDTAQDERVWQAAMTILADLHATCTVALFEPRPADYYDPPRAVCDAMLGSDINVLLASTGMLHSPANMAAMTHDIPSLCMDGGMTLEMFQSGAVTADYEEIARLKHFVGTRVFGQSAQEVRVTSDFGTDITYSVRNRIFCPPLPMGDRHPLAVRKFGDEGRGHIMYCAVFPGGEFNIPPVEDSANGTCVIDLTMHHLGRLSAPVSLSVRDGRVVGIQGGADAKVLRDYLEAYGDENASCFPTEASVGLNRQALVRGCQREDKNIFGSMHFGLGTNVDVGGNVRSNIHMDGVVLEPTVYVDGAKRIERGRFLVSLEEDDGMK